APTLLLDGIIGYSLQGSPRGSARRLIEWADVQPAPVLALDVPSGLSADTGLPASPTLRAAATLTLALPKRGLLSPQAAPWIGRLFLADIGVPAQLYRHLGLAPPPDLFRTSDLLELLP
ncbi:MAG: hypothetical protein D6765_06305, partial [Bacteroidetes bacterium]